MARSDNASRRGRGGRADVKGSLRCDNTIRYAVLTVDASGADRASGRGGEVCSRHAAGTGFSDPAADSGNKECRKSV